MPRNATGRLAVVGLTAAVLTTFFVWVFRVEPHDLTPVLVVLTVLAWGSFIILARAAVDGPQIGALSERTLIAFVLAVLATVAIFLIINTDSGYRFVDRQTASLIFRVLLITVLALPTGWLILFLTGYLGGGDDG